MYFIYALIVVYILRLPLDLLNRAGNINVGGSWPVLTFWIHWRVNDVTDDVTVLKLIL